MRFPDGSEGTYTVVDKRPAVWIVPILEDGRIVLIRNYRYTVKEWLWEVPAGGIEDGIDPMEMARRELLEEVGGTAAAMRYVTGFASNAGISNERAEIFLAQGVVLGMPRHEPSEVMEIHTFALQDAVTMIYRGDIKDGLSALAILLTLPYLT